MCVQNEGSLQAEDSEGLLKEPKEPTVVDEPSHLGCWMLAMADLFGSKYP
ncbi:MAG: hypothetical protein ABSB28_03600 [Candidatus Bathyarchaeia archaeon]